MFVTGMMNWLRQAVLQKPHAKQSARPFIFGGQSRNVGGAAIASCNTVALAGGTGWGAAAGVRIAAGGVTHLFAL